MKKAGLEHMADEMTVTYLKLTKIFLKSVTKGKTKIDKKNAFIEMLKLTKDNVDCHEFVRVVQTRGCDCGVSLNVSIESLAAILKIDKTSCRNALKEVQHCDKKRMSINGKQVNCIHVALKALPKEVSERYGKVLL